MLAGRINPVGLAFHIGDDLVEETESLSLENLRFDFHDHRGVDAVQGRLAHQGSVGLVIIIVRVSQSLVDVNIGRDAGGELGVAGGGGGPQSQVLDSQTFGGLSLVAEGLHDQLVNGLDALDDEVALVGGTTDDSNGVGVL